MALGSFLKRPITVARVYAIPVRIDYRWFGVVALSVWLIASHLQASTIQVGALGLPPLDPGTAWVLAMITTAGLFLSVFGHELSHALMGRAEGIEIEEIVLHPFGGLARLRTEPESPRAEFRIAVAGPASSFLFAMLAFAGAKIAAIGGYPATVVVFFFIAWGNLLLAVFNLFPGYPLDGGRVLRAILWSKTGNITHATRMAGVCGVLIAATIILFGIYIMIAPSWRASRPYFMGGWSILVGLFLLDTATKVVKGAHQTRSLTVGEAMSAPIIIGPDTSISTLINEVLPLHRQTAFPVARDQQLYGIVALEDLKMIPKNKWRASLARDVMRPISRELFVSPFTTLARARDLMKRNGIGAVAVVNLDGKLVGFLNGSRVTTR